MGVERSVTRWYVERQMLLSEISALEAKLTPDTSKEASANTESATPSQADEVAQQVSQAQQKLHLLGPCPKPIMG
ncbi:hypothetical protein [Ktedonobacter racemifer]|uniref:MKL1 megakaryoblastic leukemia (Translocation) 1 n=1 Tax=Ktedonobacter racemifer DSM 44963 TaxID=485913 RepID=D6TKG8_KTERA|nr:hypothetical protein [Ktedonobacter racemifer]EFH86268.1 MKL1; megakaryoblastic leukemia (translocation) 1 [Ktedonobacter racemifer DSM 44963]